MYNSIYLQKWNCIIFNWQVSLNDNMLLMHTTFLTKNHNGAKMLTNEKMNITNQYEKKTDILNELKFHLLD